MYIHRDLEPVIKKSLFRGKIILIYGARQVGKTTLARQIASDLKVEYGYLNCDELDVLSQFQKSTNSQSLRQMLGDQRLVIIDEAQRVVDIGLKLKLIHDAYPDIQLIVTGSSALEIANNITEPLTGRTDEFWLFPLSIHELWQKSDIIQRNRDLENLLVYGSYPEVWGLDSNDEKSSRIKQLASNYLYKDILKFNEVKSSDTVLKLLQCLALQIGSEVSYNELASTLGVGRQIVSSYIDLLEKTFVLYTLKPYSGNMRHALNKKRKIYFYDVGIRNAILNNLNQTILRDDVGKLFENFIISEKYKTQLGLGYKTNLYFWRTYEGQEVDLVEEKDGKLIGWEIKYKSKNRVKNQPKDWGSYQNSTWTELNSENFWEYFESK